MKLPKYILKDSAKYTSRKDWSAFNQPRREDQLASSSGNEIEEIFGSELETTIAQYNLISIDIFLWSSRFDFKFEIAGLATNFQIAAPNFDVLGFQDSISSLSVKNALAAMREKFEKYWGTFPLAFCFATIMDPRFKLFAIGEWLECMGVDPLEVESKLVSLKTELHRLYETYKRNIVTNTETNRQSVHLSSTTLSLAPGSISVPIVASTVASESCFAGGRVVSEKRASLSPSTIEALICLKDWSSAKSRNQEAVQEQLFVEELTNTILSRPDWMQEIEEDAGIDCGSVNDTSGGSTNMVDVHIDEPV
ncbi:hypothetical protein M0R45_020355 [Rubus argutus]|uniref:Uncharacterized protein n=1 Tax=Rubus argutus TaxID=59490 RepID=A0AAW1XAI3_RUBAR